MTFVSRLTRLSILGLMVSYLVLSGCGGEPKPPGLPKLYPVSLKFIQDGAPCADASVVLIPEDGSKWPTGGATNADGVAVLRTYGKYPGAPVGKYKVMVSKQEVEPLGTTSEPSPSPKVNVYHLINPEYSSIVNTPFKIEVVAGKNEFELFDLGKKVRIRVDHGF